jgi:hypothetical protein
MQEYVFRFMSSRPANLSKPLERADAKVVLYEGLTKASKLRTALEKVTLEKAPVAEAARLVEAFRATPEFVAATDELPFEVAPGLDWALQHPKLAAGDPEVAKGLKAAYGKPVAQLASNAKLQESLLHLADAILAQTVRAAPEDLPLDTLTTGYKLLKFVLEVAQGTTFPEGTTVGDLAGRRDLIIPAVGKLAPQREEAQPEANPPPKPDPVAEEERAALVSELASLQAAHAELARLATNPTALTLAPLAGQDGDRVAALEEQLRVAQAQSQLRARPEKEVKLSGAAAATMSETQRVTLTSAALERVSSGTQQVLAGLQVDAATVEPIEAARLLEGRIAEVSAMVPSADTLNRVMLLGGAQLDVETLRDAFTAKDGVPVKLIEPQFCRFEAGIGDLLMVKQTLKAYELADFAHVENVLAGESRTREHRRLDTTEEIKTTEETTETTKETDLQSTQRNEMQTEADKTIKQQFGLEAGVQISGSYGPSVQFSTHLNANFSTASEETQRKAVSFSQEVTEKTSQSIRQTIKQTVTRRVLDEIQEVNTHAFVDSSPEKDIRGVYRWLNKVYDAEILNYGQRMLYEFVIPEPAAYYLYAMIENPPQENSLVKPEPPTYGGAPLRPNNITRANYADYVAKYEVSGVKAPPSEFETAVYIDKQDGKDTGEFGRAGKIDLPDDYEAYAVVVASDYIFEEGENALIQVMIGNHSFNRNTWGCEYRNIEPRTGELSVTYDVVNCEAFALGIDVLCRLTSTGYAKWQLSVFEAVTQAYLQQKSDYEQALAAKVLQEGPKELGRNPAENLRIAKEELKKLVLMVLTGTDSIARDSYLGTSEPLMDLEKVCPNGSWIRFFENAFEWTNIIYVLYPYFWGRHARWRSAIHFTDPDPEFAAFLRAGAARVQIPVRPGFEKAVAYFCQYGEIWDGSDPPLRDDELYVPIVDEIAANLGAYEGEGVPYPEGAEPWEVHIPTELVLVEDISEVPNIVDVMTGKNVTLHD